MSRNLVVTLLLLACGCVSAPVALESPFVYVTLWKLKPGAGDRALETILQDAESLLEPIPQVKGVWPGRPVPLAGGQEFTLDGDYDLGLLLLFDAQKDLEAFRRHPSYLEFQKRHGPKLQTRVVAFSPFAGPPAY